MAVERHSAVWRTIDHATKRTLDEPRDLPQYLKYPLIWHAMHMSGDLMKTVKEIEARASVKWEERWRTESYAQYFCAHCTEGDLDLPDSC